MLFRSSLLYNAIDENALFKTSVAKEDRSLMNVCFVMKDQQLEIPFLAYAKQQGIIGIKGHRLSGGFRASLYNALPLESVKHLVEVMNAFASLNP